jgi:hypothetical protein
MQRIQWFAERFLLLIDVARKPLIPQAENQVLWRLLHNTGNPLTEAVATVWFREHLLNPGTGRH